MIENPDREIYPAAPLRFVAFEAQFSIAPALATAEGKARAYESLKDEFPLIPTPIGLSIRGPIGGAPSAVMAGPVPLMLPDPLRMLNRDRTASVVLGTSVLAVNASTYTRYEKFRPSIELALQAVQGASVAGVVRVGLRYVNEIRVPGVTDLAHWDPFIASELLAPARIGSGPAKTVQGSIIFPSSDQRELLVQFGALDGFRVDPNGELQLPPINEQHYFLLDLDSHRDAANAFWEFSTETVLDEVDALHRPIHSVFEAAITNRLRDRVFRKESDSA